MPKRENDCRTVNTYVYGGVGGHGGNGRQLGSGGSGGVGQGPSLNYDIKTEQFIMNNHDSGGGIHILHRAVALEALYDSAESFSQPKCHPETRTELLDNLYDWATDSDSERFVAGYEMRKGWAAGFFFKRGHATRGNAKVLFATLAYELALHRPKLTDPISRTVETNPSLLGRGMDVQLRNLILEPCKQFQDAAPSILLVDGLDECEDNNVQREILRLIASAVNDPGVPLRILVASRPEPHIRKTFDEESFRGRFDSINIEQSFEDVRTYLRHEFSRIHREHTTMQKITSPWPSLETLEILVEKSSGHFIYASTVIKFVDDEYSRPSQQLDRIITRNLVPHDTESPFEALDQLYMQILSGVSARYRPCLCEILCVFMHYPACRGASIVVRDIEELLGLEPGEVSLTLRPLHSVLKLPSDDDKPIEMHHASFRDFLDSEERSSIFYAGSPQHRAKLACSILKALAYKYDDPRKNHQRLSFRWWLLMHPTEWIQYIISIAPSPEFLPLLRLVNPDFFLFFGVDCDVMDEFMRWLKGLVGPFSKMGPLRCRCSPQSNPELLKELMEFIPPWDVFSGNGLEPVEFHDVVQWLRASPIPPPDLTDRWVGYLKESMVRAGKKYSDEELEERWQKHLAQEAYFRGPPQAFDEKLIRFWEACLREFKSSGHGGKEDEEASGDEDWHSASSDTED
ncbi:putative nwd2 protein [Mycena venus]|uniref:Putative nwd2 protein n=1 Tax=Mycena venus TaxID=2733690 RepID=A0A8H7CVI5_9AGAR|nr:putative nwd2 protein [Mycena venus]